MEPEVHIVEKYMQLVKGCLTMSNIRLKGGKEIDLLAMQPKTGERFHIECSVTVSRSHRLRVVDTQKANGSKHGRGLDTLNDRKFQHPIVVEKICEVFEDENFRKVLVVGAVESDEVVKEARKRYGIEVWMIGDLLAEMEAAIGTRAYRDDILRLLQLLRHSRSRSV